MKKPTLIFLSLIMLSITLYLLDPNQLFWRVKLGFISKISLIVGIIGLWLFSILPSLGNKHKNIDLE